MFKVDTYGYGAKTGTIHFAISCNYTINKIPQLAMRLQCERDGAMISQGIGWGVNQTPQP